MPGIHRVYCWPWLLQTVWLANSAIAWASCSITFTNHAAIVITLKQMLSWHRWRVPRDLFHWHHWHSDVLRNQEADSTSCQDREARICSWNLHRTSGPVCTPIPRVCRKNHWINEWNIHANNDLLLLAVVVVSAECCRLYQSSVYVINSSVYANIFYYKFTLWHT